MESKETNQVDFLPLATSKPAEASVDLLGQFKDFVVQYNRTYRSQEGERQNNTKGITIDNM